jgi:hypothetical protein
MIQPFLKVSSILNFDLLNGTGFYQKPMPITMKKILFALFLCPPAGLHAQSILDNYINNTVTLFTIGDSTDGIDHPRDLDFKPGTHELWATNYGDGNGSSTVIFYRAGSSNQSSE